MGVVIEGVEGDVDREEIVGEMGGDVEGVVS